MSGWLHEIERYPFGYLILAIWAGMIFQKYLLGYVLVWRDNRRRRKQRD